MNTILKDFDQWNVLKKKLHSYNRESIEFGEGDIWWCSFGLNIGSEQDGKNNLFERPALVLVKFNEQIALVAPLTTIEKRTRYHFALDIGFVILSQTRLVSTKRFQRFVKTITDFDLEVVRKELAGIIMHQ